jgi:hypothetical protein
MPRFQPLLCGLLGVALSACASPDASAAEESHAVLLVTLHDFKTGERFELASESHTDRVEYYSDERDDAARKVVNDEIMAAFVGELGSQGFTARARTGRAPRIGTGEVIRWGLEIDGDTNQAHWLVGTGSRPDEWQAFQRCRDMFLELYNFTVSYQAVENASGKGYFDDKARGQAGQKRR